MCLLSASLIYLKISRKLFVSGWRKYFIICIFLLPLGYRWREFSKEKHDTGLVQEIIL
jgi:hypothetical protein